ncbi:hypothetical protein FRC17_001504 [Serendipita sp. 399]|nr:hypothetical protein FRC17_001504 [Serendipita sp. 399]
MQRSCPTPWGASITLRLFSTSAVRNKVTRTRKDRALLKALTNVPPAPDINENSFAGKLLSRAEKAEPERRRSRKTAAQKDLDNINRIVTGWGEDKLAPPPPPSSASEEGGTDSVPREKPAHNSRVDLTMVRRFELEAFYRHGRDIPLFERRMQVWLRPSNGAVPTLQTIEPPAPQPPVPALSHSLDRVLFNPGAHWLRDPRSRVYNFDSSLEKVPDIHNFDFDRLTPWTLGSLARREGKRFAGSTSSLGSLLSHIYFLLANGREVDISILSSAFSSMSRDYTYGARWPGGIVLRHDDGVYCIDSHDIEESEKHLLLNMLHHQGTMLEKFLTHSPSDFDHLRRDSPVPDHIEQMKKPESYRYSKSNAFVMRSQLDAHDPRLPGNGVFDIKSRAVVAIRYDPLNFQNNSGYLIRSMQGEFESFEREQYDLFRAAFLKYQFQARIGGMDGIFVAYHNTAQIFGFQYYTREDMDNRLFGGSLQGDKVFAQCVKCMEEIVSEISLCYPDMSVRCLFETSQVDRVLRIYVEPDEWDEDSFGRRPLTELVVTATNYLNGERATGAMDFGGPNDEWTVLLSITRSSNNIPGLSESIKTERDALDEKKNAFGFWLPQGVEPLQMAERWLKLNYRASKPATMDGSEPEEEPSLDPEEVATLAERFKPRQRTSDFVAQLRKLARNGKRYLDSLEEAPASEESGNKDAGPIIDEGLLTSPSREVIQAGFEPTPTSISLSADETSALHKPNAVEPLPISNTRITVPTGPPIDAIGVQVKNLEENDSPSMIVKSVEPIQVSTEVDVGENPAINDKPITSDQVEEGADNKVDIYPADILGSEEQVDDNLDPTTHPVSSMGAVPEMEQAEGAIERDELTSDDQAWVASTGEPTVVEATTSARGTLRGEEAGGLHVVDDDGQTTDDIVRVTVGQSGLAVEPLPLSSQLEPTGNGISGDPNHNSATHSPSEWPSTLVPESGIPPKKE